MTEQREQRRDPDMDADGWPQDSFSRDLGHGEDLIDAGDTTEESVRLSNHERASLLAELPDEVAEGIMFLREGTRLAAGSRYFDVADRAAGSFVAMDGDRVRPGQRIVSKRTTDHEAWNALTGEGGTDEGPEGRHQGS